jgi:hypothetical protein
MRFWATLGTTLACVALFVADQPERSKLALEFITRETRHFWFNKEIWISGNSRVDRGELEGLLPHGDSNLSWNLSPGRLVASLQAHPLIKSAEVTTCAGRWWGCFTFRITEREPTLLAIAGDRGWIVGDDGFPIAALPRRVQIVQHSQQPERVPSVAFMSSHEPKFAQTRSPPNLIEGRLLPVVWLKGPEPLRDSSLRARLTEGTEGVLAGGVGTPGAHETASPGDEGEPVRGESPDTLRVRFVQLIRVTGLLREELARPVTSVVLEPSGDLRAWFEGLPFSVVFEGGNDENWESRLREQSARLVALQAQQPHELSGAVQVDLAFERMAVVRKSSVSNRTH